jgi:hypothetical protein
VLLLAELQLAHVLLLAADELAVALRGQLDVDAIVLYFCLCL